MPGSTSAHPQRPLVAVFCILVGVFCISLNDMLIKHLSTDLPLHQIVFVRSAIGIAFSLVILQFEGGLRALRTGRSGLLALRGLLLVAANLTYFAALAALPLADATALFFAAPLFITLLAVPFLGERVGPRRLIAVLVGLVGVIAMLRPGAAAQAAPDRLILLLPVVAALAYAGVQILTRFLAAAAPASVLAIHIQLSFLAMGALFWAVAGDGRFAQDIDNPSLQFLLRAWVWPEPAATALLALIGGLSAIVAYTLSQAYRLGDAALVAPFEYIALPLAILWGWLIFADLPGVWVWLGAALIAGSGAFVFWREAQISRAARVQAPKTQDVPTRLPRR
ncbi:MAG: DMT family transporter [Pseudomonadota bacterium]